MQTLCPTCGGKGTINDPKAPAVLCYCGPNGETCPQVTCMSCGGIGWVTNNPPAIAMTNTWIVAGWERTNTTNKE